jgi:hypothetical protein
MRVPVWAARLVGQIWSDYEIAGPAPVVTFRRRAERANWPEYSTGFCTYSESPVHIGIRAGTDAGDRRLVLLHEMAHALIAARGLSVGHTRAFWQAYLELAAKYRGSVTLEQAIMRDLHYSAGLAKIAREMGYSRYLGEHGA